MLVMPLLSDLYSPIRVPTASVHLCDFQLVNSVLCCFPFKTQTIVLLFLLLPFWDCKNRVGGVSFFSSLSREFATQGSLVLLSQQQRAEKIREIKSTPLTYSLPLTWMIKALEKSFFVSQRGIINNWLQPCGWRQIVTWLQMGFQHHNPELWITKGLGIFLSTQNEVVTKAWFLLLCWLTQFLLHMYPNRSFVPGEPWGSQLCAECAG